MRAVASVCPWALSLIFVTSCVVVTSLEAAEPSEAASAPYRHVHALVHAAGVETGHHAELLVTNDTPLAVKPRRDLYSGSEDAQSSDTPGSGKLPPPGDSAEKSPPSDGATNTASTSRSPAATETESSDEDAVDTRNVSSKASSDIHQTLPENQTPSEKTQPAEPDDNTSVDATFTLPVLEEVEQDDVESPIEPEDAPKANREAASPLVTSPGSSAVDSSKVASLLSSRDDSAVAGSSSPPQETSSPDSPAVDSSERTAPNIPSPDTADEEKEGSVPTEPHESTSDETDVNNNNNNGNNNNGNFNDDSSENRNDKSNENNNSGNDDHDENSSKEADNIADKKITKEAAAGGDNSADKEITKKGAAGGDDSADKKITKEGAAGGDDSAAATSSSEEDPGDSGEDPGDSAEDSGAGSPSESAPGVRRSPARTVNGTVLEAGPGPWDSPADRARRRNVTTFALVMCGIVGATFVILVGMWINRMRHRDRLRSLHDHDDDEEFTVFSASEARYITNSSGGGYEPLR